LGAASIILPIMQAVLPYRRARFRITQIAYLPVNRECSVGVIIDNFGYAGVG
jgi:hypothetical protein